MPDVRMPDGTIVRNVPEGMTRTQLMARLGKATTRRGTLGQLWDNTVNDVAGIAQGVAGLPDLAATAAGKIMSAPSTAGAYGLEKLGFPEAAKPLRRVASALANPPTIGGAIEAVAPAPDTTSGKVQRFAGRMVGGMIGTPASAMQNIAGRMVGQVPKGFRPPPKPPAKPPASVVDEGRRSGVRVMTSDVRPPRTFVGKSVQAMGERIPYAGTGGVRQAQQAERVDAVRNLAREYGAAIGDDVAAPAIDDVMADLAARRGKELTNLTKAKTSVINGVAGEVPVAKTVAAIDSQIGELQKVGTDAAKAVIGKLQNWRQAVAGKDLPTIELIRKEMGEAFKDPNLASIRSTGEKALSSIYGPMRDDMAEFIKVAGGQGAYSRWKVANDRLAGMAGELQNNALRSVLKTGQSTPEDVSKLLFSTKPSDVKRLYNGLSGEGRAKAQAAILQRALEKAGGMETLSPEKFISQVNSLGKSIGIFFQGNDLARIEGLRRVLDATRRAGQASLAPPTGVQNYPTALTYGLGATLGWAGIPVAGSAGLLARAYESAPVRNMLLALSRTKPGSRQEGALLSRVTTAISANAANNRQAGSALNDNLPAIGASAAQSPDQGPDQPY